MAEDGIIAECYPLVRLPKGGYRQRTRQNVVDSDGIVIIYTESQTGGTRLTRNLCALEKKPHVLIDARRMSVAVGAEAVVAFVTENGIQVLNVAGAAREWVACRVQIYAGRGCPRDRIDWSAY